MHRPSIDLFYDYSEIVYSTANAVKATAVDYDRTIGRSIDDIETDVTDVINDISLFRNEKG